MSRVRINDPLPGTSHPAPLSITVSWEIDAGLITMGQQKHQEALKKYQEEYRKYQEECKKLMEKVKGGSPPPPPPPPPPIPLEPPPPFLVRLRLEGGLVYYQFHFTATYTGVLHIFNSVPATVGASRIYADLIMTQCTSSQADDTVLDADSIPITVT